MKDKSFKQILNDNKLVKLIGAHDGFSAKLGEMAGFDAIWASGFEIASAHCVPDANILSMSEVLHAAEVINNATNIPVIADCDSGFGDINNVIHMIKLFESRHISGICIEDKLFPKMNSFIGESQALARIPDFCAKISAAQDTKKTQDFMVIARVESLIAGQGIDDAVNRASAYVRAGADAILIHSKQDTPKEIFEFCRSFKAGIPIVVVPTTYYKITAQELSDAGINAVIYANHGIRSAYSAMKKSFASILENDSTVAIEQNIASMQSIFELQNMGAHVSNHEKYNEKIANLF